MVKGEVSVVVAEEVAWVDAQGVEHIVWSRELSDQAVIERVRSVRGSPKWRREKKRRGKFVRLVG